MIVPRITRLQFQSATPDSEGAVAFNFRPSRPLRLRAGQHGLWLIPGVGVAPFTVASAPEEDVVTLGTSVTSKSRLKRALQTLEPGDSAFFIGPLSAFSLDPDASSVVMLAQGVGVTPFRSILRHLSLQAPSTSPFPGGSDAGVTTTLVHVGHVHPFRADTEELASTSFYPANRDQFADDVAGAVVGQPDAMFMVSGSPEFVSATSDLLAQLGVDASRIQRDKFWGYHPQRLTADRSTAPAVHV